MERTLVMAATVAILARAAAMEEVFSEPRQWLTKRAEDGSRAWVVRKVCYMSCCPFCLSFWLSLLVVIACEHWLFFDDWRGLILSVFAVMGIANVYMECFSRLRLDVRRNRAEAENREHKARDAA
jgi:hypothetical protein